MNTQSIVDSLPAAYVSRFRAAVRRAERAHDMARLAELAGMAEHDKRLRHALTRRYRKGMPA